MSDQTTIGPITFSHNNPGSEPSFEIGKEQETPSGKKYRDGEVDWFVSGGDTRAKIRVILFPDGKASMTGQFKTEKSSSGDLIHIALEFYDHTGKIVFSVPKGDPWKAPGRKIYPRDNAVGYDAEFEYNKTWYDFVKTVKVKSWG